MFGGSVDQTGFGIFAVLVRDIARGKLLVTDISNGHNGFAFSPNGTYLYWLSRSDKGRPSTIFRRAIGKRGDTRIYDEKNWCIVSMRITAAGGYVVIRMFNGDMTEVRMVSMDCPTTEPFVLQPRTQGLRYNVDEWNGKLLILTDADDAIDFKLMMAGADKLGRAGWQPFVAHYAGRLIAAVHPFKGHLVR